MAHISTEIDMGIPISLVSWKEVNDLMAFRSIILMKLHHCIGGRWEMNRLVQIMLIIIGNMVEVKNGGLDSKQKTTFTRK